MASRSTVTVRLLGQEYRIRGEEEPEAVHRAAALLEETLDRVRARSGTVDTLDVALLAALNLARQVVGLREGARHPRGATIDPERVAALVALLESAADGAAAH